MITKKLLPLLLLGIVASAGAAKLTPYQEAALNKILAGVPPEQRAAVRPNLETTLSALSKEHIDMMLAGMEGKKPAPAAQAPAKKVEPEGEWGAAEADFDQAFSQAQGYIARISDVRDMAGKDSDLCRRELNLVPISRKRSAAMADILGQQDRMMLRIMVEHRARYTSAEGFAAALNQPVSSPLVQAVYHYFQAPMSESDVKSKLMAIQAEAATLHESHERERKKIMNGNYADRGAGVFSKIEEKELAALEARTAKATTQLCAPGLGYFHRGLVTFMDPVVPKIKKYVQ